MTLARAALGYVCATLAASMVLLAPLALPASGLMRADETGIEFGLKLVTVLSFFFVITVPFTFCLALLPAAAIMAVSRALDLGGRIFFAVAGMLTGLLLSPVYASLLEQPPAYGTAVPVALVAGAVGGLVFARVSEGGRRAPTG